MYKTVDIAELTKDTRNIVNIKMRDGKEFEIGYCNMVVTEKYHALVQDGTEQTKALIRTEAVAKLVSAQTELLKSEKDEEKKKRIISKIESYQDELQEIYNKKKCSSDRYLKRVLDIVKAICLLNGYDYDVKYWKGFSTADIWEFIRAVIEKDIDPVKKKEL